ncbi:MAG: SIR2 family protein [Muribaculaceae bacterium]|nr:SIR2 family protein [Muribaculaceae bacterium]
MKTENLTKRIIKNANECALILGNGINNYAETGCSWLELLKQLHELYLPNTPFRGIDKGISYTEFFDALEISILEHNKAFEEREFKPINFHLDICRSREISYEIQNFSLKEKNTHKTETSNLRQLVKSFNKENVKFKEFGGINLVLAMSNLGGKLNDAVNSILIKHICQTMAKWKFSEKHYRLVNFAQTYNIPILTTNYDNLLAKSINANLFDFSKGKVDETLPISCCYTTQSNPDINKFAIWHPNGMLKYPKSILIGLSHYMRNLEKIRSLIIPNNVYKAELFEDIAFGTNAIKNTWINLIFSKNLYIVGLSLDTDEVLIRWLLLERAKLFSLYPKMRKDCWFVITKRDYHKLSLGKKYFFKSIGCNIIVMDNYDSMYNAISI